MASLLRPIQSVLAFLTIIPTSSTSTATNATSSTDDGHYDDKDDVKNEEETDARLDGNYDDKEQDLHRNPYGDQQNHHHRRRLRNQHYQDIHYVANNMYLFPLAGAIIGIIVGGMGFAISEFLQPLIVGLLIAGSLVILTGVHHTDALADFADGLMAKGDKEKKKKAMADPAVGSAGVAALVMYFAGMIIVFDSGSFLAPAGGGLRIFASIIAAEVIAKYIMVLLTYKSISAWEGFSSPFTAAMRDRKKLVAATAIMLPIVFVCCGIVGMVALAISIALGALLRYVSKRSFGGISGDVLGASNEISRLASLIVFSSMTMTTMTIIPTVAMVGIPFWW